MDIKVLYFASAKEIASTHSETLVLPEGSTISGLADMLVQMHPALTKMKGSIQFSVNFDVVGTDSALKDGDEVGVLPPVAGG